MNYELMTALALYSQIALNQTRKIHRDVFSWNIYDVRLFRNLLTVTNTKVIALK